MIALAERIIEQNGRSPKVFVPLAKIIIGDFPQDIQTTVSMVGHLEQDERLGTPLEERRFVNLAEIPELPKLWIVDGFHKIYAANFLGREEILAEVRLGCNQEEVNDLRILTHSKPPPRQNPVVDPLRLSIWISEAWQIKQASAQEFEPVSKWVERKSEVWNLIPSLIYQYLNVGRKKA